MHLREFIARRPAEIRQQLASLRAELRELDIAEAACSPRQDPKRRTGATIKEMSRHVLHGRVAGTSTQMIRELIQAEFGVAVTRESLAPQLSRLKAGGVVAHTGLGWKLTNTTGAEQ